VIDDWENADIDDMASKIASKDLVPATGTGKIIRAEEEDRDDEDLDTTTSTMKKPSKETAKVKNAIKASKVEEEKGQVASAFDNAIESQSH